MTERFTLPLSPELEQLRTSKPGARRRQVITTPRDKLSVRPASPQSKNETQSKRVADGELASTIHNTVGGVFWNEAQWAAADAGVPWDQVDAMVPMTRDLNPPFVRPANG